MRPLISHSRLGALRKIPRETILVCKVVVVAIFFKSSDKRTSDFGSSVANGGKKEKGKDSKTFHFRKEGSIATDHRLTVLWNLRRFGEK